MPTSTPGARREGIIIRPDPRASLAWVAAIGLLIASGFAQGRLTGRWATPGDMAEALARLDRIPRAIGTWQGEDAELDRESLRRAGIAGGISRRYRDARTGATVTMMLVCGRPGPVSVHTPDVCYEGAGYELDAPPSGPIPGFLAATMARPESPTPDRLQVYWSWNATGPWEAPANPRLSFGGRPHLYKLYVIRSPAKADEALAAGPGVDFARALTSAFDLRPGRR